MEKFKTLCKALIILFLSLGGFCWTVNAQEGFQLENGHDYSGFILSGKFEQDRQSEEADLFLTKTMNNPTPKIGESITFTIFVVNAGPNDTSGVEVIDQLPSGLLYQDDNSGGLYDPQTGLWSIGAISVGTSVTLTVKAIVKSAGVIKNTAEITASDLPDPDSIPGNGESAEDDQDSVLVAVYSADLALTKTVSDPNPTLGTDIVFTITVTNDGPNEATGVEVYDPLPSGLTYQDDTSSGSYDPLTGIWTIDSIKESASATVEITTTVDILDEVTNTAEITASDLPDPDSIAANSDPLEDDISSITIAPTLDEKSADLSIVKSVDNPTPKVGEAVVFTLELINKGPYDTMDIKAQDVLPTGLSYQSDDSGGSYNPLTGLWTVGSLVNGASVTINITAAVEESNEITNAAFITHSNITDPNTLNNSSSVVLNSRQKRADLFIRKTVDNPAANVNDTVVFTITVFNSGPDTATGVEVTDLFPQDLDYYADDSDGAYDPATGVWTIGIIERNSAISFHVSAVVKTTEQITNAAFISHSDILDPNITNNSASTFINGPTSKADLYLTMTVDNPVPNLGETVVITFLLRNDGLGNAKNVKIKDFLPSGLTYQSDTSLGNYDPATGIWSIGSIYRDRQTSFQLTATVNHTSPILYIASITNSSLIDPDITNNTALVTLNSQGEQADLFLKKTVDNTEPDVGDLVVFTITVGNLGPDLATAVEVRELLPEGLTYISDDSGGDYNSDTGLWTIGLLLPQSIKNLTITARADDSGQVISSAVITNYDNADLNPTNNSSSIILNIQSEQADLAISKIVDNPSPISGENVTFTIRITNNGLHEATGVKVNDTIPDGMTYLSQTSSFGSYSPDTGIWVIDKLAVGQLVTLNITARADVPEILVNTAEITDFEQVDPDTSNNSSSVAINTGGVPVVDLSVNKKSTLSTVIEGNSLLFFITLRNNGPSTAYNVHLSDVLPSGLEFISAASEKGNFDSQTGLWTIESIEPNKSHLLAIKTRAVEPGEFTNTAIITDTDEIDINGNNNLSSANVKVTEIPEADIDVSIEKEVNLSDKFFEEDEIIGGQEFTYSVVVKNNGPDDAVNTIMTADLPEHVSFVNAQPTEGTCSSTKPVQCELGTIQGGERSIITFKVIPQEAEIKITQSVTASSTTFDPVAVNNTASLESTVIVMIQGKISRGKIIDKRAEGNIDKFSVHLTGCDNFELAFEGLEQKSVLIQVGPYLENFNGSQFIRTHANRYKFFVKKGIPVIKKFCGLCDVRYRISPKGGWLILFSKKRNLSFIENPITVRFRIGNTFCEAQDIWNKKETKKSIIFGKKTK